MIDPYKMIVINGISSVVLIGILLFYKFVYPKKNINLLILLILISIVPTISIFRPGAYESGDFTIHIYRTIEFYKSLQEGNIVPSWAAGLNATYGYPLFIFNYSLPYYLISLFHSLGFTFIMSMKLFLAFNFILSGIFMYFSTRKLLNNNLAAFTSAVFYQFAPYHLIDLHFKVVIGEILSFTILPLTFWIIQKMWENRTPLWFLFASISVALLIMSHVVIALFSIALLFCYALFIAFQKKEKFYITTLLIPFLLGSLFTIHVWLTPFFLTQYTQFAKLADFVYFPQWWELLFSPWRFGFLFQGPYGELSYLLGYIHTAIICISIYILFNKKSSKKIKPSLLFFFVALVLILFLITPWSKPLWGLFTFLKVTGSHRLLLMAAFISAILAGYVSLYFLKKKIFIAVIIVLTIFSTILNWGQRKVLPEINDQKLINNVPQSTANGEGHFYANPTTRSVKNPWFTKIPKELMTITSGKGDILSLRRTTTNHTYVVKLETKAKIRENTLYFPGWKILANDKSIPIKTDKEDLMTFTLPKGLYAITILYNDLPVYTTLKMISGGSFLVSLFVVLFLRPRFFRNK